MGMALAVLGLGAVSTVTATSAAASTTIAPTKAVVSTTSTNTTTSTKTADCKFVRGKTYPGGPGHRAKVRAGIWKCGSLEGICINFGLRFPNSSGFITVSKLPKVSTSTSHRVIYLVNKYGDTKSDDEAADLSFAAWYQLGGNLKVWYKDAVKKGHVSKAQAARVKALVSESKRWKPKLSFKVVPVVVNETGNGSVTVKDGLGNPIVGITPKVTLSGNAEFVVKPGETDANGVSTFKVKPTDVGAVKLEASISGPSGTKALLTKAGAGRQRILGGNFKSTFKATAQFEKKLAYEFKSVCNTDCKGVAKVTFGAERDAGGAPARYTFSTGTKVWASFDVKPGQKVTEKAQIPDGTWVSVKYEFIDKVGGKPITKAVSLGKFEVVCPPWLEITSTTNCNCNGTVSITLHLAAPGGLRYYKAVVKINNKIVATKKLGHKARADVKVLLERGDRVTAGFTAYRTAKYTGSLMSDTPYDFTRN